VRAIERRIIRKAWAAHQTTPKDFKGDERCQYIYIYITRVINHPRCALCNLPTDQVHRSSIIHRCFISPSNHRRTSYDFEIARAFRPSISTFKNQDPTKAHKAIALKSKELPSKSKFRSQPIPKSKRNVLFQI
jgi:hypothetical protein